VLCAIAFKGVQHDTECRDAAAKTCFHDGADNANAGLHFELGLKANSKEHQRKY